MTLSIEIAGQRHPVIHRVNRRLRNVYLQIRPEGIVLKSPGISRREAEELLLRQRGWLERKLAERPEILAPEQAARLPDKLYLLGSEYPLQIAAEPGPAQLRLDPDQQIARLSLHADLCQRADLIQQALDRFYLAQAREHFHDRLIYWSMRMQLAPRTLRFKRLKSRWGSCSSLDAINLNYLAIQLPPECIDAILVHELAHLRHLNHGKAFWKLVKSQIPDYEDRDAVIRAWTGKLLG